MNDCFDCKYFNKGADEEPCSSCECWKYWEPREDETPIRICDSCKYKKLSICAEPCKTCIKRGWVYPSWELEEKEAETDAMEIARLQEENRKLKNRLAVLSHAVDTCTNNLFTTEWMKNMGGYAVSYEEFKNRRPDHD